MPPSITSLSCIVVFTCIRSLLAMPSSLFKLIWLDFWCKVQKMRKIWIDMAAVTLLRAESPHHDPMCLPMLLRPWNFEHRTLPRISPGDIRGILGIYHKYTTDIPRPPLGTFVVYLRYSHKIPRISPGDIWGWVYSRYISGIFTVYFRYI